MMNDKGKRGRADPRRRESKQQLHQVCEVEQHGQQRHMDGEEGRIHGQIAEGEDDAPSDRVHQRKGHRQQAIDGCQHQSVEQLLYDVAGHGGFRINEDRQRRQGPIDLTIYISFDGQI